MGCASPETLRPPSQIIGNEGFSSGAGVSLDSPLVVANQIRPLLSQRESTTKSEASPSLNTKCETGSVEPGMTCAERAAILKPAGSFMAFQTIEAFSGGSLAGVVSLRNH